MVGAHSASALAHQAKSGLWPCRTLMAARKTCSGRCTAMPITASASVKLSQDELKKQAAWKAVEFVKSGMKVGLGTGSTAAFAVDRIGQLLKDGTLKDIVAVPTSIRTYEQALSKRAHPSTTCRFVVYPTSHPSSHPFKSCLWVNLEKMVQCRPHVLLHAVPAAAWMV